MALTPERRGELALLLLKDRMKQDGMRIDQNARRQLHAVAQRIRVDGQELEEFMLELLPELISDAFGFQKVALTTEGAQAPLPRGH